MAVRSRIGVISDTHGVLSPGAREALAGTEHIVHAGDVGPLKILDELRTIAPVTAVKGNMDVGEAAQLPRVANFVISGVRFLVGHKRDGLVAEVDPGRAGARVVISGHTHRAAIEERDGVLYVNPGSATRPPDGVPPTVAVITLRDGQAVASIVEI